MRVLAGWDDPGEAELLKLYLDVEENGVVVVTAPDQLLKLVKSNTQFDVIMFTTNFPNDDESFELFQQVQKLRPDCPVVCACKSNDVYRIARYLTAGMRSYVIRDEAGDYMFLLQATLESAIEAVRAQREKIISEKLREEIESVRKLQASIIPKDLVCPEGYEVRARYEPSQIRVLGGQPVTLAGGDYYDVFMLPDNRLVLLVGDASGHGMKACMSIMTMHTLVSMIRSDAYRDTAAFVHEVNNKLCDQQVVNEDGGFITLVYAILNLDTHELQWTSAGHPFPIVQELGTDKIIDAGSEDDGGLPLGIMPDVDYTTITTVVPPNSRLLLYTDGLAEAFSDKSEQHVEFGISGIMDTMERTNKMPLEQSMLELYRDSTEFTGAQGRHDDTSVVYIERR
jgi:serine phosphatase RsbU (regulator of sigma subunit)